MSQATREITFATSMTLDKRAEDFAYLRENLFDGDMKGLYPSADFKAMNVEVPASGWVRFLDTDSLNESGTPVDGITIVEDLGSPNVKIYATTTGVLAETIAGATFKAAARDNSNNLHVAVEVSGVQKLYIVYSPEFIDNDGDFTTQAMTPYLAGFDGLNFYWTENSTGSDIYRSAPQSTTNTKVFDDVGFTPAFFDFYGDQMVLFGRDTFRKDVYIVFWDKSNSTVFDKRIIEKNARLIAGGVVDGKLMLIKTIGNSTNLKEQGGKLVVTVYDGEKFVEVNSMKIASNLAVKSGFRQHQSIGNGVLAVGLTGNEDSQNADLYRNWLLKIFANGRIETLRASAGNSPFVVHVGYDEIAYVESNLDFTGTNYENLTQVLLTNKDTTNAYADYENYTGSTYITNFLNNSYNLHKLDGLQISFEKLFEQTDAEADPVTGEALEIYYRISERDDWTLIDTITAQKVAEQVNLRRDQSAEYESDTVGLPQQKFDISQMMDGSSLPEFNEIQFKFVSLRGFSIIQAIYSYSYLSRTQLN